MRRIRAALASLNPHQVLLAALLSAVLAWVLREPFTSLILAGKTFTGRGLPVQAFLLGGCFVLLLAVFLFPLSGVTGFLLRHARSAAAALALVPLAAHAWMGSFSRFVSDDFSSAALASRLGVWGAAGDWYMNWTGRFSANLVDSLTGALGQKALGWQVFIVLLVWTAALAFTISCLLSSAPSGGKRPAAVFLAAAVITVSFQLAPDLPQSLYWAQGMHSLVLPLSLGTVLAAVLLHLRRRGAAPGTSPAWAAGAGLLAFAAAGFGETYASLQTLVLALALAWALLAATPAGKKLAPALAACLAASLLAMVVIILSPGNAARQAHFPPTPSLPAMLWIAFQAFLSFLGRLFSSPWKVWQLAALFISALLADSGLVFGKLLEPVAPTGRPWLRTAAAAFLTPALMYACFVPSAFGMSTTPPDRTLIIPAFLLAVGTAALGCLLGSGARAGMCTESGRARSLPGAIAWLLFIVFTANLFFTTRIILSPLPEYSRFARVSDKAEELILQARRDGLSSVEIPEVHNPFGLSDFGAGTTGWLDNAVDQYYGLRVIVNKNLNHRYLK